MKRKVIITALLLLSIVMIVTIGYSIWNIANDPIDDVASGNIVAYGVVQNGEINISIVDSSGGAAGTGDDKVTFGSPRSPVNNEIVNSPPWLIFNDIGEEHLTVYMKVEVTYPGIFEITDDIFLSGVSVKDDWTMFTGPTYELDVGLSSYTAGNAPTLNTSGSVPRLQMNSAGYAIIKVTYHWPSLFERTESGVLYSNPYYYFNNVGKNTPIGESVAASANNIIKDTVNPLTGSSTYAEFAIAYLNKLYTSSSNISFKITFTEVLE